MNNYKPLDNIINNTKNYIQNNSEKIWKGVKYGVILPTALAVSLSVAPNIQNAIHKFIPIVSSNISQVVAAELEKPYQIFDDHIYALFDFNRNSWLMEKEPEINNDPKFKPLMKKIDSLLNYPEPNHKLLMDLDNITSIKFNKTDKGYDAVVYVGPMRPENAITVNAEKIFNIPKGVDIAEYMNPIFYDAFYINEIYHNLDEKRKIEERREDKKNELIETRQNVILKAQEAKQKSIDDYTSRILDSMGNTIEFYDLDGFKKISNVYRIQDADEMLNKLDIPKDALISYNEFSGIDIYNIILDYNNLNDGNLKIINTKEGFDSLFDVPDSPPGRKVVSRIRESRLEDLVTDDVGLVISDLLSNKKNDYYIIRDLEDGKPSFGIVGVPVDMKVKVGEILAKYVDGVKQGYDGARFIFPEVKRDVGDSGTPVIPVPPVPPVPPDECENTGNITNNEDTGNPSDSQDDSATTDVIEATDGQLPSFTKYSEEAKK